MAPANRALWQDGVGVSGVIRDQPLPTTDELGDRKVLVKGEAWAMNPCDGMLQNTPLPFVKFPVILDQDIAGTVEAVAPGKTAAKKFKDYVPVDCSLIAKIPNDIPYSDAVVFGLCITTSSFSLFGKGLPQPRLSQARHPKEKALDILKSGKVSATKLVVERE
ncbi:hypothetical protein V8F33_002614 [Rhypophila sp. PSN 637]